MLNIANSNNCCSKQCKKTSLIVCHSLSLVAKVAAMGYLAIVTNYYYHSSGPESENIHWDNKKGPMMQFWIALLLAMGSSAVGLFGVIRENVCTLMVYAAVVGVVLGLRVTMLICQQPVEIADLLLFPYAMFVFLTLLFTKDIKEERGKTTFLTPLV